MQRYSLGLLCVGLALLGAGRCQAEVKVQRINYQGWAGAYRLYNRTVELVYVPQIGRISRYAYLGGKNALWENPKLLGKTPDPKNLGKDWVNYGGDKLWPAPQAKWGWPPDPLLDRGGATVQILSGNRLLVTNRDSKKHGIRFSREITLDPVGTGVTLKNTLTNTSDQDVEWSVWEVAQMREPETLHLPIHKGGKFPAGYYTFKDAAPYPGMFRIVGDEGLLTRHPKKSCKLGADSPKGALSADKEGVRFTISAAYEPGQNYPDDGCAQEIWCNPDPDKYAELEILSPIQFVQPGDSYSFKTRWRLTHLKSKPSPTRPGK